MNSDYPITVIVKFNNGSNIEFLAKSKYQALGDGRIVQWSEALVENKKYATYSIPIDEIRSIAEG